MIGTQLAVSIIAGLLLGHYVDEWAETKTPWFTFVGLIAGMVSGFGLLIRLTKRKNDNKGDESD